MEENRDRYVLPKYVKDSINEICDEEGIKNFDVKFLPGILSREDTFVGGIMAVDISEVDSSQPKSVNLIVKIATSDDNIVNKIYVKELFAYKTIIPALYDCQAALDLKDKFTCVKYYKGSDEPEKEYIILENMKAKGYTTYGRRNAFDSDHLALAMKTLANFHATSFVLQRKDPKLFDSFMEPYLEPFESDEEYDGISDAVVDECKKNYMDVITDADHRHKLSAFLQNLRGMTPKMLDPKFCAPYNVICHTDCWNGNILFKYRGKKVSDAALIDWQSIRLASPIVDIAYMLCTCTNEIVRSTIFLQMLDLYYETLESNVTKMGVDISECFPKEIFRKHLKLIMPWGLRVTCLILPVLFADEGVTADKETHGENAWYLIPFSNLFKERMRGIVKTLVENNYI